MEPKYRALLLGSVAMFGIGVDAFGVSGDALFAFQFEQPPVMVPSSGDMVRINAATGDEISVAEILPFRIEGPEE